jgi:hypothetical protein
VTSSEAGQQKRLLLLDTDWQEVESIPIDVGRRFFHVATPAAAAAAAASNGSAASTGAAAATSSSDAELEPPNVADGSSSGEGGPLLLDAAAMQRLVAGGGIRRGDVLHLRVEQGDAHEEELTDVLQLMSQQGGWVYGRGDCYCCCCCCFEACGCLTPHPATPHDHMNIPRAAWHL